MSIHITTHLVADRIDEIVQIVDDYNFSTKNDFDVAKALVRIVLEARDEARVDEMAHYYGEIE